MQRERLLSLLSKIYGAETSDEILGALTEILERYRGRIPPPRGSGLSERDAILITYADQVQEPGKPPLAALGDFCGAHLPGIVSGVHLLPFYRWSSDDGFSVVDYKSVAPQYGTWDDIRKFGEHFRLMFDAVVNHASAESSWFKGFLLDDPDFRDFFIEVQGTPDLSMVVRPRTLPLLTAFDTSSGRRQLWTTFSADQIDLNYHNPRVLLCILDVLLFYASQGAEFLRLDAIAYLWKEPGTASINLPQTHWIVQLMRAVLDEVAPHVMLITETNVPNLENLSYFGDGSDEAQMVYNFPLPPLVLHALHTGRAGTLTKWALGLQLPSPKVTFLNFLASHDGIGLNPVSGILPESEIDAMASRIESSGGFISKKTNANGTQSPYEINANYFDALNAADVQVPLSAQIDRFVTAHSILLAFMGMPALYFHSLFGSRGWPEGVQQTGKYRSVNRQKLERSELEQHLRDAESLRAQIFARLAHLLRLRSGSSAFAPHASQRVLQGPDIAFALLREDPRTAQAVLCVHNVTPTAQRLRLDLGTTPLALSASLHDLISDRQLPGGGQLALDLSPYETLWLTS
jgi:glucosylglycerate phosphorylase